MCLQTALHHPAGTVFGLDGHDRHDALVQNGVACALCRLGVRGHLAGSARSPAVECSTVTRHMHTPVQGCRSSRRLALCCLVPAGAVISGYRPVYSNEHQLATLMHANAIETLTPSLMTLVTPVVEHLQERVGDARDVVGWLVATAREAVQPFHQLLHDR